MKKIILMFGVLTFMAFHLNAQINRFENFLSHFTEKSSPFTIDNYSLQKGEIVPSALALVYICNGDSSLLTFENIGINQETREIVYRNLKPYIYKAYVKIKVENFYLLIYDGYVTDGYHEFTSVINVGLFDTEGILLDEMPFYIFDDTGKLNEQIAQLTEDNKILIIRKAYIKNEKGIFTRSYNEITETYEIGKNSGKFIKTDENIIFIDKSKK